ncbi:hypothetical protein FGO68_gene14098 [Halteria grandinella]|uniref:Uncharacterized protein n=1 Tax=Halteria grandinella TaxID=5974 RepID=A0A8J8NSB4_HALGN|nr:hypothetical protein FGO68_gene14098 [Halteria grandinella]
MERPAFEGPPMERPPFEGPPMNRPPIEGKFEGPPFKGVDQIQNREKRGTSSSQRNQFDGGHSMPPRGQFGPDRPSYKRQEASNEFDYSENFHPGNFEDFRGPPPHERNQRNHRFGEDKSDSQRKEQPSSFDEDEEDSFDFEFAHSSFDQQEPKSKDNYDSKKRGQHNWESRNGDPEQRAEDFVEHHFMIFKIFGIGLLAYLIYRIYNAKFAKPSSQSAFVEPACRCLCSNAPQFVAIPVQQQLPPQNPIIQQQVPVLPQANSVSYQVWSPPSEDRMPLVQKNPSQMN